MRIVVVSNLCPPDYDGGFELSAFRLARGLRARGHAVDLVTSAFRPEYGGPREDEPWVHRIFRLSPHKDGWADAKGFLQGQGEQRATVGDLLKLDRVRLRLQNLRAEGATVAYGKINASVMETWLAGRERADTVPEIAYVFGLHRIGAATTRPLTSRGIPLVFHAGDEWLAARLVAPKIKRALIGLRYPIQWRREREIDMRRVILNSEFLRRTYLDMGFPEASTSVVYRGVEFEPADDVERPRQTPPLFFAASRLTYYKGIPILLRAAGRLHRIDPERIWTLEIAGAGDPGAREELEAMTREEGIAERTTFLGKLTREATLARMREATAFISPSVFAEPMANTNIEALAMGTPVIASRVGGNPESVEHEVGGLLYEAASNEELAAAMLRLLDEPETVVSLARGAVARVRERFTLDATLSQVETAFVEAIAAR